MLGLNGDASSVSAASGTAGGNGGTAGGNDGTVYVQSGGDLNVDMKHVDLSARGENGAGGSLYLIAGMRGNPFEFFSQTTAYDEGNLSVQGAVKVDEVGTGRKQPIASIQWQHPLARRYGLRNDTTRWRSHHQNRHKSSVCSNR